MCSVNKGDFPLTIEWFLNGKRADTVRGISVKDLDKKASYLNVDFLEAGHGGKFTCRATNWAGSAYYTAVLSVKGRVAVWSPSASQRFESSSFQTSPTT